MRRNWGSDQVEVKSSRPVLTIPNSTYPRSASVTRIRTFLDSENPGTPCLVVDLRCVRERYLELAQAMPGAKLYYAVKANPAPEVLRLLVELGARFDVASPQEIELCLAAGASPRDLSYGNTVKKRAHIAAAHALGVRLFTTDSRADLVNIAEQAPGSSVFCRIVLADTGSLTPFGRKFGCAPEMAVDLLRLAAELPLEPAGVSFHVGSQQLNPAAWDTGIAAAAAITGMLATHGVKLPSVNVGGGFPGQYTQRSPPLADYAAAVDVALERHFHGVGLPPPEVVVEPGRFLVADAGVLRSEVVLISRKSDSDVHRWVYLDVGRYSGLAETENEYITYLLSTPGHAGETGPVILAGPTCDGDDVLYQRNIYHLPLGLRIGDHVDFLGAGAYTASYSSIGFNGFAPLPTYCV